MTAPASGTLTVTDGGVQLAYLDSGALQTPTYITLVAIHGTQYGFHIYDKLIALAPSLGVRFVAISRRNYFGSTTFTADEISNLATGTDTEKGLFLRNRATELAVFLYQFIQQHSLPPVSVSEDGVQGGIALMGWSLGSALALSVISQVEAYPENVQTLLGKYLHKVILHEPPQVAIGKPFLANAWNPFANPTLSPQQAQHLLSQWMSAYFQHGDLSTRSLDCLEFVVPSLMHSPSIFTMPSEILSPENFHSDGAFMRCSAQLNASYRMACFDQTVRARFPNAQIWIITGTATLYSCIAAAWNMEDENAGIGGGFLHFKWIPGANHFVHWDEAEIAMTTLLEVAGSWR